VARLILGLQRKAPPGLIASVAMVNVQPMSYLNGVPYAVVAVDIAEGPTGCATS
jgi:hypothetical protein